jgi:hypothetical protein
MPRPLRDHLETNRSCREGALAPTLAYEYLAQPYSALKAQMAQVAPAPAEGTEDAELLPVVPAGASSVERPVRRQSTMSRFKKLSDTERNLAFTLRALGQPRTRYSLLATLVVCTLLMLLVAAPYAVNERMNDARPVLQTAVRGLIVGIWVYFMLGPMLLVILPIISLGGGFHPRFLLSLPLTLGPAVGFAFIPLDGSTLGVISIGLLTGGISYTLCRLALVVPFFATDEHKALSASLGPPLVAIGFMFFGLVTAHLTLTQLYSSPLTGVLLPAGSAVTRQLAIFALARSLHKLYFEPKQTFLTQFSLSAQSRADVVPPLLGDIEAIYGPLVASFALIIGNAAAVATIVEAALAPTSMAWVVSLAVSLLIEVLTRTGVQQRFELWVAAKLAANFELQWPTRLTKISALELVYLHSLGGTGYVAPTMAVCIGCVRAATFGDPYAIVWLDVTPTVWKVLLAQLASQVVADAAVLAMQKLGRQQFALSTQFAAGHPLSNTALRDFGLQGYAYAFGIGGMYIYVAFLGPAFVTGMCRLFTPNATNVWVVGALECVSFATYATVAGGLVNGSRAT